RSKHEWNIVFFHEPMYSNGYHGSSEDLRAVLEPLFLKYNVDLVFQGHDHNYERTYPVKNGEVDEDEGIVYVTLGGGGAPLYFKRTNYDWSAKFIPTYHFAHIKIKNNKLNMIVYDKSGDEIDTLEIKK
ncbi:MAG: metallophosphoesterase, partial [Elusimicrobiales bacterium]|nr:metallophosphoesterase [Elusimicrobiales bacterium]